MANAKNGKDKKEAGSFLKKLSSGAKIFVLDTNVIIHNPESILSFEDNGVVIPSMVIEELDNLKKGYGEVAYSARQALRLINKINKERKCHGETIQSGLRLDEGGVLIVYNVERNYLREDKNDNWIISAGLEIQKIVGETRKVILVSKDTAPGIKAESMGLMAEDYDRDKSNLFSKYGKIITDDYTNGILSVRYQFLNNKITRFSGKDEQIPIERGGGVSQFKLLARNVGQECALDALRDPRIKVVVLTGLAGCGKTLLPLAVGLSQAKKEGPLYDQVTVCRLPVEVGAYKLGYLPGEEKDKLEPWMYPIADNLDVLMKTPRGEKDGIRLGGRHSSYRTLIQQGYLEVLDFGKVRGRTFVNDFFIFDEAQNSRPLDVKTAITRCGEGTKIVLTGDLEQIDKYVDEESNGLSYLISRFINEPEFCFINLEVGERSSIATKAALLL